MGIVNGPCTLSPEQSRKAGRQGYGLSVSCQLEANRNGFYNHSHLVGELQHLLQSVYTHNTHTQSWLFLRNHAITNITVSYWSTEMHHSPVNEWHRLCRLRFRVTHVTNTSAQNPAFLVTKEPTEVLSTSLLLMQSNMKHEQVTLKETSTTEFNLVKKWKLSSLTTLTRLWIKI